MPPVVDVEAYIGRELIGGFRKLFHPPVPVHPPEDPVYAESEIFIDPYPVQHGPADASSGRWSSTRPMMRSKITVTFGVAHFGIGMPFTQTGIMTPTMIVTIPPHGRRASRRSGSRSIRAMPVCRSRSNRPGTSRFYSQRNIDVGEPLNPQIGRTRGRSKCATRRTRIVTITMALINHRPNWQCRSRRRC